MSLHWSMSVVFCVITALFVYFIIRAKFQLALHDHAELKVSNEKLNQELENVSSELKVADSHRIKAQTQADRIPSLESKLHDLHQELIQSKSHSAELDAKLASEKIQSEEKLTLLSSAQTQMKTEFENLAQQILETKSKKFTEQNKDNLSVLLNPLKEQLQGFRKRVDDIYEKDSSGRTKLIHEIEQLKNLNIKISEDAMNLTNALRGENKTQGNWGEMVLEKLLEQSGLRKGHEYEVQGTFRNDEGKMLRPDVILRLPEGKDIIIDSKVSLTAHDEYINAVDAHEQEQALKRLVLSIRSHIKELRSKNYDHIKELSTLDYVFMFVPIDGVYTTALEADPTLYQEMMDNHIMVVTPSTLMLALKMIYNIWRHEHQNDNALEIARKAGDLYDKFVSFAESLTEVGARLDQAQKAYGTARNRLCEGNGNLVTRTEQLKKLGAKAKKSIPDALLTGSDSEKLVKKETVINDSLSK